MATIWCTLSALVFAWLRFGAHWMLWTPNLLSANTIAETTKQRIAIYPKMDHHCATHLQAHGCKIRMSCQGVNKAKYASLMLSRCFGYYLVYTECPTICLATIWCTLNVRTLNLLYARLIVETIQQRTAIDPKRIITVLSFTSPLMPNKNELPGGSLKQYTDASCSRVAMATIWWILNALVSAWLLFDAHWMLRTLICLSAKTFGETTQQRIGIDPKRIINVLPIFKPTDAK